MVPAVYIQNIWNLLYCYTLYLVRIRITFRDVFFLQQTGYLPQNNGRPHQGISDGQAIIVDNKFIIIIITICIIIMIITIYISVQWSVRSQWVVHVTYWPNQLQSRASPDPSSPDRHIIIIFTIIAITLSSSSSSYFLQSPGSFKILLERSLQEQHDECSPLSEYIFYHPCVWIFGICVFLLIYASVALLFKMQENLERTVFLAIESIIFAFVFVFVFLPTNKFVFSPRVYLCLSPCAAICIAL